MAKAENKKKILLRLSKYVLRHKVMLFSAIALTLTSNFFGLLWPLLSGYAIESIELGPGKVEFDSVMYYVGLMLLFTVISSVLSYILAILMVFLSQKIVSQMRREVYNKLSRLPVGYFDKFQAGDLISRITYDIDTINASITNDIIQICTAFITVVGSLFMMIYISPFMVLIVLFTVPVSIFYTKIMTTKIKPLFKKRSAELGKLNGFVEEMISGQKTIKAYHRERAIIKRFDRKNKEAIDAYYNAEYYGSTVGPTMNFINNFSLSIISMMGTILYFLGRLSIGNVSSFVLYSRRFSGPINEVANIISELQSSIAAAQRVFNLLDESEELEDEPGAYEFDDVNGEIKFEDVTFSYIKGKPILKNLNLHVKSKQLIAVVGHTGSGKTTLINLLMRFYDPDKGTISLDNVNIKKATRKSLRLSYAMVLQDTWLFYGTIFDNVSYGKKNASLDEVKEVCKKARIHDYIMSLPDGYDTIITSDAANISGGQRQLLTIARAMMLDSKMLILDEATSNVDTLTEMQIQEAMRSLMAEKTCFVIAHRLSTIRNADVIVVVDDGEIVEQGTHKELLEKDGTYAQLSRTGQTQTGDGSASD